MSSSTDLKSTGRRPSTARGERTRAALVAGARRVFERDGYLESRLTDITAEAGCAIGSFYTYFDDKAEIFRAVLEDVTAELLHPGGERIDAENASAYDVIRASNRAYLEAYQRNAKLMYTIEQVAAADPQFRDSRRARSEKFLARNERAIKNLQDRGLVDPSLDPQITATALSAMVSRTAYHYFGLDLGGDLDTLVETLTTLWANALKLER